MLKKRLLLQYISLLLASQIVLASNINDIKINGFATTGVSATNDKDVSFYDANNEYSFSPDSLISLQLNMPINEKVSFTAQLMSRGENDYDFETGWAFAEFKVNQYVGVKAGRLRLPVYMISQSLEVGYSYPWVRPPIAIYGQLDFDRFDGIDMSIRIPMGDAALNIQPFVGANNSKQAVYNEEGNLRSKNLRGFNMSLAYEWFNFRLGYAAGNFDLTGLSSIETALSTTAKLGFNDISEKFNITDFSGEFFAVGLKLTPHNFLIMAEYAERKANGIPYNLKGGYLSLAYTVASFWTPYVTFEHIESDEDYSDVTSQLAALKATGNAAGTASPVLPNDLGTRLASSFSNFISMSNIDQDAVTLGSRFEVMDNIALKFEWQYFKPEEQTNIFGLTDTANGESAQLYSIALDYVF